MATDTVDLPVPTIVTAGDLRNETDAATSQVELGDSEATAARSQLGSLYDSWTKFRDDFYSWKRSLNWWETAIGLTVAGTPNDWEQARSFRLQAINWRKRIAELTGVPVDPSTNVKSEAPTDFSWIKWGSTAVIVVVVGALALYFVPKPR